MGFQDAKQKTYAIPWYGSLSRVGQPGASGEHFQILRPATRRGQSLSLHHVLVCFIIPRWVFFILRNIGFSGREFSSLYLPLVPDCTTLVPHLTHLRPLLSLQEGTLPKPNAFQNVCQTWTVRCNSTGIPSQYYEQPVFLRTSCVSLCLFCAGEMFSAASPDALP